MSRTVWVVTEGVIGEGDTVVGVGDTELAGKGLAEQRNAGSLAWGPYRERQGRSATATRSGADFYRVAPWAVAEDGDGR